MSAADGNTAAVSPLDVLTLAEVAGYLGLPDHIVRAEALAGRLFGRCISGEWRFLREEVIRWERNYGVADPIIVDCSR
jgi:hypothetical protein